MPIPVLLIATSLTMELQNKNRNKKKECNLLLSEGLVKGLRTMPRYSRDERKRDKRRKRLLKEQS